MQVAVTGATGFIGRYIVRHLAEEAYKLRCWYRSTSDRSRMDNVQIEWVEGDLAEPDSCMDLVNGCDAVVHAALYHPGGGFRGDEGDIVDFAVTYANNNTPAFVSNEGFPGPLGSDNLGEGAATLSDFHRLNTIPEPASLALIGLGTLAMVGRRRH